MWLYSLQMRVLFEARVCLVLHSRQLQGLGARVSLFTIHPLLFLEMLVCLYTSSHHVNAHSLYCGFFCVFLGKTANSNYLNIRSKFLKNLRNVESMKRSGAGASEVLIPTWKHWNSTQFLKNSIADDKASIFSMTLVSRWARPRGSS